MIVVRLNGGLGNQLFQYAFGRYLSNKHSTDLFVDTRAIKTDKLRTLQLHRLVSDLRVATPKLLSRLPGDYRNRLHLQFWNASHRLTGKLFWAREKPFGFHPDWLELPNNSFLDGYWQSEQFLPGMKQILQSEIGPTVPLSETTLRLAEQMRKSPSLALHIRRGDYVASASTNATFPAIGLEYYHRVVEQWLAQTRNAKLFVFSDDITWCREAFIPNGSTNYVDHTTGDTAHEDLYLMTQAAAIATANSTLSWWGAWLNKRPDVQIYSPSLWFRPGTLDDSAIRPMGWIVVQADEYRTNSASIRSAKQSAA